MTSASASSSAPGARGEHRDRSIVASKGPPSTAPRVHGTLFCEVDADRDREGLGFWRGLIAGRGTVGPDSWDDAAFLGPIVDSIR